MMANCLGGSGGSPLWNFRPIDRIPRNVMLLVVGNGDTGEVLLFPNGGRTKSHALSFCLM